MNTKQKNIENLLELIKKIIVSGQAERLENFLSDNAVYFSEANGKEFIGKEEVINRLNYVMQNTKIKYFSYLATICKGIHKGERCVVLAENDETYYTALALIETEENKKIKKIYIIMNSDNVFLIDGQKENQSLKPINKFSNISLSIKTILSSNLSNVELEKIFTDTIAFLMIYHGNYKRVKERLIEKYKNLITNSNVYILIAFVTIRMQNASLEYLTSKKIVDDFAQEIVESENDAKSNETLKEVFSNDEEYGLKANKPIYCDGVVGSKIYLKCLETKNGQLLTWNRVMSMSIIGINGCVDVYESFLSNGNKYKTVYINMYANSNSIKAPLGFRFNHNYNDKFN